MNNYHNNNLVAWVKGYVKAITKSEDITKVQLEVLIARIKEMINAEKVSHSNGAIIVTDDEVVPDNIDNSDLPF